MLTYIAGQVSLGFCREYRQGVQAKLEALFFLLLPLALIHFLQYQKNLYEQFKQKTENITLEKS